MNCSHCQELCQQARWLLIGCTRVISKFTQLLTMTTTHKFPSLYEALRVGKVGHLLVLVHVGNDGRVVNRPAQQELTGGQKTFKARLTS